MSRRVHWRGYEVPEPVYDICRAELKGYPYLKRVMEGLSEISGEEKKFVEQIVKRTDLETRIGIMEEALAEIPQQYREPAIYIITTKDSREMQKEKLTEIYNVDEAEALLWVEKLIYLYADVSGLPVSGRGAEHMIILDQDGNVKLM